MKGWRSLCNTQRFFFKFLLNNNTLFFKVSRWPSLVPLYCDISISFKNFFAHSKSLVFTGELLKCKYENRARRELFGNLMVS